MIDDILLGGQLSRGTTRRVQDTGGVQGWTEFVRCAALGILRQMWGYLVERKQQEQSKRGHNRLVTLSKSLNEK